MRLNTSMNMAAILLVITLTGGYVIAQSDMPDVEIGELLFAAATNVDNVTDEGAEETQTAVVDPAWEPRPASDFKAVSADYDEVRTAEEPEPIMLEPVAVEAEPAAFEPEPMVVAPELSAVEPEPAAVEPEPAAVEPEPAAVEVVVVESDPLAEVLIAVKAATNAPPEQAEAEVVEDEGSVDDVAMDDVDDAVIDSDGQLISVRLNKVGLEDAITLFAQLSGANIIVPELAEASQISVNLKDVEWRPALQSILDSYNYELYQKVPGSNVFSVRRRPEGAPEPMVVETFKLEYATVPNVAKLVRELLPPDAKVSEFASRNMLVVKSTEAAINEIRAVLVSIDKVRQQVFIESKFMELNNQAQEDLGIDWQVLQSYSVGTVGDSSYGYDKSESRDSSSTIYKTAEGQQYDEGSGYLNSGSVLGGVPVLEGLTPSSTDMASKATKEILTSVLSADEFRLVLSALEENTGVNIVSNPKIIVANEEEANISIIRREPNLKQESKESLNDSNDTLIFTLDPTREFFDFGIKLDVTPSINTASNITVKIHPSLTRKFKDKPAGATTYPIIDEKSIKTVFSLASGQTAAIGGLTEVEESEVERKVPVLGSIPFLGRLFSYSSTLQAQKETIIFVTVGLANTQNIELESGLPGDTDLARRQLIKDRNTRILRDKGRIYFEKDENDKLDDLMNVMDQEEKRRSEKRANKMADDLARSARSSHDVLIVDSSLDN